VIKLETLPAVPTKRERITFVCDLELRDFLEKQAMAEKRSLSNFIEKAMEDMAKQDGYKPPLEEPRSHASRSRRV